MVRELRNGNGQHGLILANGGVLTYQHVVCLSTRPRRDGSAYPDRNPLPPYVKDVPVPSISAQPEGEAVVETYTVEFNRNGAPSKGFIVGRLTSNNHRFVANTSDARSLEQLSSGTREPIDQESNDAVTSGDPKWNLAQTMLILYPQSPEIRITRAAKQPFQSIVHFECGSDDAYNSSSLTNNRDRKSKTSAMPAKSEVDPAHDDVHTVSNPPPHDRTPRQNILLHNSHCHGNDSINSAMIPPPRPPPPQSPSQKRHRGNSAHDAFAPSGSSRYQNRNPNYRHQSYNGTSQYSTREGNGRMSGSMGPPAPKSMDFDPVLLNSAYDPANSPNKQSSRPRHQWNKLDYHLKPPNPSSKDLKDSETQSEDAFDQDDVNMSLAVLMELASDLSLLRSFLCLYKQFDTHLGDSVSGIHHKGFIDRVAQTLNRIDFNVRHISKLREERQLGTMEPGKLEETGSRITEWFNSKVRRLYNVMSEKVDMCNDVARNNWVARKKAIWNDVMGHVLKDLEELDRVDKKEVEDMTGLW
ncbi:hypothetical protein OEA41_002764 [Lepraria neglecta]|uniref:Thiolase-like protein type 1 additional C-terminal domain-containing protein n=1 Tax=Lepraria neglecta TaxID=209136 RepID=A0AAE0DHP4_9LECA|nr:hypothetical protein OEA41_002764 [Lepraria neglecta]